MRGDITHSPYAGRAREYSWSLCTSMAPRKITPSDIDFFVECNGHFAFFEMKSSGAKMLDGQQRALNELAKCTAGRSILFIVEHQDLDRVVLPTECTRFMCRMWQTDGTLYKGRQSPWYSGQSFPALYSAFFTWADSKTRESRAALNAAFSAAIKVDDVPAADIASEPANDEWVREYDQAWPKHWSELRRAA